MTVLGMESPAQARAIAHDPDGDALALVGAPGSGKSFALLRRAYTLAARPGGAAWLVAPSDRGVRRLRAALAAGDGPRPSCESFGTIAFEIVREARAAEAGTALAPLPIDDVAASLHFERAGAALFSLEWTEFVSDEIDPEITGLRAPERFSAAAFRLIRKLRASLISPEEFRALGLRGATAFYGRPPNFASADLIMETQARYRDSLRVTPAELERQHAREIDLVKILARLYASYVATLVDSGALTPTDAVYEATLLLRAAPERAASLRTRLGAALVDDAQDLTGAQLGLLEALYGPQLRGVTLAGDAAQSTRGFATGGRGAEVFKRAATTIELAAREDRSPAIERAAALGADPRRGDLEIASSEARDAVQFYRATTLRDEVHFVASEVARALAAGAQPASIAVIVRGLPCAHAYIDALLARGVPLEIAGAGSIYAFPAVADALAVLWSATDPFRHDHLLRTLAAPWLRLADASIAALCGDAAEPQPLLFEPPGDDEGDARAGRWDRRRDLRLGRNVTGGDVDIDLPEPARARLVAFRAARDRWSAAARTLPLPDLARLVLGESSLAACGDDARGRFDAALVARLLDAIDAFAASDALATLEDFLVHAERVAAAESDLLEIEWRDGDAVRVLDVEAAKGTSFETVFVTGVRAGAWPRYYVPDAFLFLPSQGMIPKDNVGDAAAARTAKFTYTMFRHKLREKYNAEERRAFYCAATRARRRLYVSTHGRPTRGVAAPEILAELEKRR